MVTSAYRELPSVDRLLADARLIALAQTYGHQRVAEQARAVLDDARRGISGGESAPTMGDLVDALLSKAQKQWQSGLRQVINATGVVIHTNLGRAPLSPEAIYAMSIVSKGYSNLEFDLDQGERGSRHVHVESLLTQLTGAEAALVVNNNASAVFLGLSALAHGKEVVVSRGEAVEIGGGFRIPDVLRQSGAQLVEVGTTNRTYVDDYDAACSHETAAFLRVHSSNFRVVGFTHGVALPDLVALARRRGVHVLDDLGSGCFLDTTRYGLLKEPAVQESIAAGVDLAFFSGDKLLGGPQAGIIVGKKTHVDWLKRHPLARAVRIDKASLAGLAATLLHYLRNEAEEKIPVWSMIAMPPEKLASRARAWRRKIGSETYVVDGRSMIGGGSLPEESLPTKLLSVPQGALASGVTVDTAAALLRAHTPAVVARIEHDRLLFDPRTVLPGEDAMLVHAIQEITDKA